MLTLSVSVLYGVCELGGLKGTVPHSQAAELSLIQKLGIVASWESS